MKYKILFSVFLVILCSVNAAFAADLKIVDKKGLTRAQQKIGESARVTVILKKKSSGKEWPARVSLINIDGLASDIDAGVSANGVYQFNKVYYGTWKIEFGDADLAVAEVKIEK